MYYTDESSEFKLIHAGESTPISKRNIGIWNMILNRLDLPDHLHEFATAILVSGNWHHTDTDEIPLMRMAKSLTSNEATQIKIFNRLKHNSPKFFKWQEEKKLLFIKREVLVERASRYRTKARYSFPLYKEVVKLFELPVRTPQRTIRRAVDKVLEHVPKVEVPAKKDDSGAKAMSERIISQIIDNINKLTELRGSLEYAAGEASCYREVAEFAKSVVESKGLN